jgi:hypothetical protein
MVKGFEGTLEFIQHDYDRLTYIPSADYLIVEGSSHAECLVSPGQAAKLPACVSATSSSFEMVGYRACTSISIPTIRVRMRHGFDGVRTVSGECDDHRRLLWVCDPAGRSGRGARFAPKARVRGVGRQLFLNPIREE